MSNASSEYIERAVTCEKLAASVKTNIERDVLLRRAESLRAMAANEVWLAGDNSVGAKLENSAPREHSPLASAAE